MKKQNNNSYMGNRCEIERVIKENNLDRSRIFECLKLTYASIISKTEQIFVPHGGDIHWASMDGRFNPKYPCETIDITEHRL